jgi:hypothetical protein
MYVLNKNMSTICQVSKEKDLLPEEISLPEEIFLPKEISLPEEIWYVVFDHCTFSTRKRLWSVCRLFTFLIYGWKKKTLRVASFDIGKTNFAQYLEDFDLDDVLELRTIYNDLPSAKQRRTKGALSQEILFVLDALYRKSQRVSIGVFDFTDATTKQSKLTNQVRLAFLEHMCAYKDLFATCDLFIIEQQFVNMYGRNRGINLDAVKLGEGLTLWILEHFPSKSVQFFGSQYKTQVLGAPTKLTKPQRKKWSVEHTEDLFQRRKDEEMLACFELSRNVKRKRINTEERVQTFLLPFANASPDIFLLAEKIVRHKQKLDDVSDVVLQLQAYKYRTFIAQF